MAGAGKKTFTAGEVLTASDVNTYLMEQSVMVFGGTAARSSAIPTPSEGMVSYRTDVNGIDYYNGSAWVGANGLDLINTTSFTAQTNIDILNCFSSTYDNYQIEILVYNTGATGDYFFNYQLVSSTTPATGNYVNMQYFVSSGNASAIWSGQTGANHASILNYGTNGTISTATLIMHNPNKATYTNTHTQAFAKYGTAAYAGIFGATGHLLATAYDGIRFLSGGTNAATGIIRVYGLRNS